MEWKPVAPVAARLAPICLGNFLSGMETAVEGHQSSKTPNLGNFLSGMETGSCEAGGPDSAILGNFLSGMETRFPLGAKEHPPLLPWKLP